VYSENAGFLQRSDVEPPKYAIGLGLFMMTICLFYLSKLLHKIITDQPWQFCPKHENRRGSKEKNMIWMHLRSS